MNTCPKCGALESFYNDDHGTYVAWECGSKYVEWDGKEPQFKQTDECRIAELEQDRLAAIASEEVAEFNAGYEAGQAGAVSIDDQPHDIKHDQWRIGYQAGVYDRLAAIVAKLPKCWRLVDGKLVQDEPVYIGKTLWYLGLHNYPVSFVVYALAPLFAGDDDRLWIGLRDCCASREAAEAALAARKEQP
jgi:hypothetical protein